MGEKLKSHPRGREGNRGACPNRRLINSCGTMRRDACRCMCFQTGTRLTRFIGRLRDIDADAGVSHRREPSLPPNARNISRDIRVL